MMDTSNFKEVFESPKVKEFTAQVAALDAEVLRLRNALKTFITEHEECEDGDGWMAQMCSMEALHVAGEVLSTPFIHTALHELIEKVEKLTIERCADLCSDSIKAQSRSSLFRSGAEICAGEIRALTTGQIKLEELL